MWFTRVSIGNPVLATMVMLAFVVLGLFSYQRLKVDQFPNIDFPRSWSQTDYPGASPEIVESEVTKKIEEGGQHRSPASTRSTRAPTKASRSSSSSSSSYVDGRKAADDVREKVAAIRPLLRDEVKEPRVCASTRPSAPICQRRGAARRDEGKQTMRRRSSPTGPTQVLKKRLENVRGVGSVTLVGGTKREINLYLQAGGDGGARRQRRPGGRRGAQREPGAAARRDPLARAGARGADRRAHEAARGLRARSSSRAARAGSGRCRAVAGRRRASTAPQEIDSLALYNGQRTLLLSVQKSQDENTIEVVDGLNKALAEIAARSCRRA